MKYFNKRRVESLVNISDGKIIYTRWFGVIPFWRYPTRLEKQMANQLLEIKSGKNGVDYS